MSPNCAVHHGCGSPRIGTSPAGPGARLHVELVAQLLRSAVYGKVFGRGHDFQIFRIIALQPTDKGEAHAPGEIWGRSGLLLSLIP
jgi:hypothetical protein